MSQLTQLSLHPAAPFDFPSIIASHGWPQLAPFEWQREESILARPECVAGQVVELTLRGTRVRETPATVWLDVRHAGALGIEEQQELTRRIEHMLSLRRDLRDFHELCRLRPELQQVVAHGQGRILRSPTIFEDLVKTILTTNVNWAGTLRMARRLVDTFGSPLPWDSARRTFPEPAQLAAAEARVMTGELGLGYRGPFIHDLAQRVAGGQLDLSRWEDPGLDTEELYKELRGVKGIGDYAASHMLMLLGRPDRIPIDSWARKLIGERFFAGQTVSDAELARAFDDFGCWRGLAFWFWPWEG